MGNVFSIDGEYFANWCFNTVTVQRAELCYIAVMNSFLSMGSWNFNLLGCLFRARASLYGVLISLNSCSSYDRSDKCFPTIVLDTQERL